MTFFNLEMGVVEIYKSDQNGKKLTLWHIETGHAFCLANMFAGRSFANAKAATDCLAFCITRDRLEGVLAADPDLAKQFIQCISSKLAAYSMLLEDFTFKKVEERLVKLLVKSSSPPAGRDGIFICNLSRNELAGLLGTCREVVSRTLKKLKEEGLISFTGQGGQSRIIINDHERLREKSEEVF
ncbi:MAG: Crp/Fnr family transcriptional regulator [Desulfobulbaceae bacterium]|nr:Crp/Fnr family transcriptional regulator [Desulfobulbaceae bacterium]